MSLKRQQEVVPSTSEDFKWLDQVSDFMDSKYRIPLTNIRFGADFVIGLVPYAGDFLSFGISATMIIAMARHGVSAGVLLRMIWNVVLDTTVGAIPILGDIFDLAYRANRRNFDLLKKHYTSGKPTQKALPAVLTVIAVLLFIFILIGWIMWKLLVWVADGIGGIL